MTRKRCSRYTVYFDDRDPLVVLAYSDERAAEYYRGRGYSVSHVSKGDHIAKPINGGGFTINKPALDAAIREIGLKLPVRIRFNARVGNTNGNHRFRRGGHDIMLKRYHSPEQVSETLWHELCHAMQAERAGGTVTAWNKVRSEQRRYTYRQRPIELEARAFAEDHAHIQLCF